MDWTKVTAINHAALARVMAELAALLELALPGGAIRLPPLLQQAVGRILRPAEAALRRFIIILARDVKVKPQLHRPMPQGLKITARGRGPLRFRLYDLRKRFAAPGAARPEKGGPRVHFFFDRGPLIPALFTQKPRPDRTVQLCRRFLALQQAFSNLAQEAQRLARWRARRKAKAEAGAAVKFTSPLRPGPPPGHQRRPRLPVDFVLEACHGLAFEALQVNSS